MPAKTIETVKITGGVIKKSDLFPPAFGLMGEEQIHNTGKLVPAFGTFGEYFC